MALIRCPECNREISDKSKQCIHCGYPLEEYRKQIYLYDIILYGYDQKQKISVIKCSREINNLSLKEARDAVENLPYTIGKSLDESNATKLLKVLKSFGCRAEMVSSTCTETDSNNDKVSEFANPTIVLCPRCGSTAITTGQRGYSLFTGFLGSNKTVNRCGKCGYSWEP